MVQENIKKKSFQNGVFGLVISLDSLKSIKEKDGYEAFLLKKKPTMVILDEAHHIRNPKTYSAKAVFKFTKVKYRLALTGTPAYGEQKDIFSILHFLYPDQFKTIYQFQNEYMIPEQYVIYVAGQRRCFTEYHNFYPQATKRLTSFLKTISTNRKRSDVMQWLPEKDRQTIRLPATEKQKEALTSLRDTFTFGEINTVGVLDSW